MTQLKRKVALRQKVTPSEVEPTPQKTPKAKKPWWPWVLGALVVCGGLTFLLTHNNNNTGNRIAEAVVPTVDSIIDNHEENIGTSDSILIDTAVPTENHSDVQGETRVQDVPQKPSEETGPQKQSTVTPTGQHKTTPGTQKTKPVQQGDNTAISSTAHGTIEEEAWRTIRGNYGNGAARKEALGNRYAEIQAKVNEFYRDGKLY